MAAPINVTGYLNMSVYHGTFDAKKAKKRIEETTKQVFYQFGFTCHGNKPVIITKDYAFRVLNDNYCLDVTEFEDRIVLNDYSIADIKF